MATNKVPIVPLVGASFATGALATYMYNRYLARVEEVGRGGRRASTRSSGARSSVNDPIAALFNQNDIGVHVLNLKKLRTNTIIDLARVYAALGGTTFAAVIGVFLQQQTKFSTSIASLISLGLALSLQFSKSHLWKLLAFGLFNGMSLGGLVKLATRLNPSIVPLALGSTTLMFSSFAAAATLSSRRSLLYLYGVLGSALTIFSVTGLANTFIQSKNLFSFNLYGGLAMFMGYVMADSQLIIERADQGDDDYVTHAWLLFSDLSAMFSRLLIILIQQTEEDKKRKKKKRDGEYYD